MEPPAQDGLHPLDRLEKVAIAQMQGRRGEAQAIGRPCLGPHAGLAQGRRQGGGVRVAEDEESAAGFWIARRDELEPEAGEPVFDQGEQDLAQRHRLRPQPLDPGLGHEPGADRQRPQPLRDGRLRDGQPRGGPLGGR